uniref:Global nitrogen transcriptional regulator n=1 Tax=Kuetzingia canaliculata TaxID=228262 RepID=A0A1Z1MQA2_KUECA|nr:global nitrogen transcriptional regulator [Kuetzingia canaliculata]ARW67965.1 global nitrogen transcriptional regulator [Kuetzingia canaliculata]
MKWINFLIGQNIPYYIYKLHKEDTIIVNYYVSQINKIILIIDGSIYCVKVFPNKELLPIALLKKNNLFRIEQSKTKQQFYYQLKALKKTYIITFNLNDIYKKTSNSFLIDILYSYDDTLKQYEIMNEIMSQKYIKNRIFQIILLLCLQFGKVNQNKIYLTFKISYRELAILSGTNKTTVSRILKKMNRDKLIEYYKKNKIYICNIFKITLKNY